LNAFEGSNNRTTYWDNALTLFKNELYLGTIHRGGGGQIWRTVPVTVSGSTGVAGVSLGYSEGTAKTVASAVNGGYSFAVPYNWDGTVTPTHACFTFDPASRDYSTVKTNQGSQNYAPTVIAGCGDVNLSIGGTDQGRYGIPSSGSVRTSFAGLDKGPVKIESNNAVPILGAERLIYKVNGVATSFAEMMALPNGQLDNIYWLPWYNNVGLNTQLRFANVSNTEANIHVTIGGDEMLGSPFTLAPGASARKSYPGIDKGPVRIESDVDVVAAARVIYKINNINTSSSELMALPNTQLANTYVLPWYNSKSLDTQLRIANVSATEATVHVFIGGIEMGTPFALTAGASKRLSFVGIDKGPVKIESNVNIVAAERVIYKVNGVNTSFSEMMGLPSSLLNPTYWLPWYNNLELNTQLRFGAP
jgi:hypothetical protein